MGKVWGSRPVALPERWVAMDVLVTKEVERELLPAELSLHPFERSVPSFGGVEGGHPDRGEILAGQKGRAVPPIWW